MQLPTYNWTKNHLVQSGISKSDSIWTFLASSTVSGACVVCTSRMDSIQEAENLFT